MPVGGGQTSGNRNDGRGSRGGNTNSAGGGFGGGLSSASQRHRNRQAEIERVAKATNQSSRPTGNTGVSQAGRTASALAGMGRDYRDVGNSTMDNIGNFLASQFGFNQQRPTMDAAQSRATGTPAGQTIDKRAGWGFDPAGMIGSLGGMAMGLPFGGGFLANQLSSLMGRPLEMGMGPSVFGGGPSYGGTPSAGGGVQTASGSFGSRAAGGGTGNGNFGYTPFRSHTTGNPNVRKPVASIPQQSAPQQQNPYAQPQGFSPFGSPPQGKWSWG